MKKWPLVWRSRLESVVDVNAKIAAQQSTRIADLESQNQTALATIAALQAQREPESKGQHA